MQGDFPLNGAPDQIAASSLIGGVGQHNPFFAPQPQGLGQPRIIGDPTLSGPQMQPGGAGSGIGGNLIGPNAGIFQGGPAMGNPMMGGPGNGLGPFPPHGGMGVDPFGPGGMMFHQPEGFGDLDPGLPDDPMRIGGVRRPNRMMGPNNGGMFGPNGNLGPGGFGPGGFGGPGAGGFGGSVE